MFVICKHINNEINHIWNLVHHSPQGDSIYNLQHISYMDFTRIS